MKWVPDNTGRFKYRPYYEAGEIDCICDELITGFLREKYGSVKMPILTDDIELLIESKTSDFDPYADLTEEGKNVEGMTEFYKDFEPAIFISESLSHHYFQENRRRTTLTHELGHVIIHAPLWTYNELWTDNSDKQPIRCNRENIENASVNDWMEWQAYYASGAYLMPISQITLVATEVVDLVKDSGPFYVDSSPGRGLIDRVKKTFHVSGAATRVRLQQLGYITNDLEKATIS